MASLVSMTSRTMMAKLQRNIEVKVTEKVFSSINTLHFLCEAEFHNNIVLTRNTSRTLEMTKLDFQAQHEYATTRISEKVQLGEGNGKGNGSNNHNKGGQGNGNGGDDDDYFHHFSFDDDDGTQEGRFGRCDPIPENFDPKCVQTILQEWDATIYSLPNEIHQAVEMKIISSAQMVRFLSTYAQPTMTRTLSRMAPEFVSRALMGRILADPAFLQKLLFDEMVTIACALWREFKHIKDTKEFEWDVVVVNVLTSITSIACMNWTLAPSQSYASNFKYNFQNALQKLPNHVFDKSSLLQEFDMVKRVLSFVYKAGELGLLGLVIGALASVMPLAKSKNVAALRFSMSRRVCGYGAFMGLSGNVRYQVVFGLEKLMQDHFEHLGDVLFFSTILEAFNILIGDASRVAFWGQGNLPIVVRDDDLPQAYCRKTRRVSSSKSLITSIFDGIKDHNKDSKQEQSSNLVDKKKVRRKVTTRKK